MAEMLFNLSIYEDFMRFSVYIFGLTKQNIIRHHLELRETGTDNFLTFYKDQTISLLA